MTFHARELSSYRQLPQLWYHFQTKGRDEPRPRAGLLRVREFVMKDSYSFDRDEEGLDASYWKHAGAYRRIFDRCGLRYYECEGDVGLMGGEVAHEYLAPCPAGENEIALCASGDYAANVEAARRACPGAGVPRAPRRAARGRDSRDQDDRGCGGVPLDRSARDRQGDARGRPGREAGARADPRRPPPARAEDDGRCSAASSAPLIPRRSPRPSAPRAARSARSE